MVFESPRKNCEGCGNPLGEDEFSPWCNICEIMIPRITGLEKGMISSQGLSGDIRAALGNPNSSPSQIWTRIARLREPYLEGDHEWIFRHSESEGEWRWITSPPEKWDLEEGDIEIISGYSDPSSTAISSYHSRARLRKLQRGGSLPDGSHLSWSEGSFFLDGSSIQVPYKGLMEILRRPPRGLSVENIDWRMLLLTLDLANQRIVEDVGPRPSRSGSEVRPVIHPAHLLSEYNHDTQNIFRRAVPYDLATFSESVWLDRWGGGGGIRHSRLVGPRTLVPVGIIISKGNVQLRVRREHGWRKIKIKSDPRLWARIATWSLSPPDHIDRVRLNCIQQNLFVEEGTPLVPESEVRGIGFLRGIVESSSRVTLRMNGGRSNTRGRKGSFLVMGTSGLSYRVSPGKGESGTRFIVRSEDRVPHREAHAPPWGWSSRPRICIVETPDMRRLSLGDAMGSVILTLLSDEESKRSVNTIAAHISTMSRQAPEQPRQGEVMLRNARMLARRMNRNRALREIGRCREGFPRLWGALLRMRLGERMTFTAMRRDERPNVTFDGAQTAFRTTSAVDRAVVYSMLAGAGWVRDRHEEDLRGQRRVYIRVGTGERDLAEEVRRMCDILDQGLEQMFDQRELLRELMPEDLRTHFEQRNPGICALLPGTDRLIE